MTRAFVGVGNDSHVGAAGFDTRADNCLMPKRFDQVDPRHSVAVPRLHERDVSCADAELQRHVRRLGARGSGLDGFDIE